MRRIFRVYRDWLFLLAYLVVILFILPFSVYGCRNLVEASHFFSFLISSSVHGAVILAGIILIIYVVLVNKGLKIFRLLILVGILLLGLNFLNDIKASYDKLHIIEYSILSFLLFRVLRFYNPTTALYFWCIIFIVIAGLVDECVQIFLPGRGYSLQDLKIDVSSGILSQLTVALVICPRLEKWRIKMTFFKKRLSQRERWIKDYKIRRNI